MNRRMSLLLALPVFCLFVSGCGSSSVVSVSGTLKFKGKPVTNAFIHFVPANGRPSMGETDSKGQFTLTYDPQTKGAEKGKHKVLVMVNEASLPSAVPGVPAKLPADLKELFDKYGGEKSTATVTIEKAISDLKLDWD